MMLGDDIRNQRLQAEKDAALPQDDGAYLPARGILALFVMAEQLYELRANLAEVLNRLEDRGRL